MQRTYREIASDTPEAEIARLREQYPTLVESRDGEKLWLSRLPEDDKRVSTVYETEYAYWIPGNPMEALRAILLISDKDEVDSFSRSDNQ